MSLSEPTSYVKILFIYCWGEGEQMLTKEKSHGFRNTTGTRQWSNTGHHLPSSHLETQSSDKDEKLLAKDRAGSEAQQTRGPQQPLLLCCTKALPVSPCRFSKETKCMSYSCMPDHQPPHFEPPAISRGMYERKVEIGKTSKA